ncbi:MAG TPA: zf-TFIIB domain-containing protein [Vicinamibacteria bacterium]|nr:zf-TFIIB domain-containing protein [Vicinamibacteria bacterium]
MSESAGALSCPHCGAPAAPEAPSCPYCRTPLALVACPSCFSRIFQGARHCAYCGAEAVREEARPQPPRPCPECGTVMSPAVVGSVTLDECTRCGGVWVDPASFERICAEREEQAVVLTTAFPSPAPKPSGSPVGPLRYWPCPECRRLMNRQNFAHVSGIMVDVCKGHGVWFSHGELRQIVEFIRAGGLERARQREKTDLEDERRRLRSEEVALGVQQRGASGARIEGNLQPIDYGMLLSAARDLLKGLFR